MRYVYRHFELRILDIGKKKKTNKKKKKKKKKQKTYITLKAVHASPFATFTCPFNCEFLISVKKNKKNKKNKKKTKKTPHFVD